MVTSNEIIHHNRVGKPDQNLVIGE